MTVWIDSYVIETAATRPARRGRIVSVVIIIFYSFPFGVDSDSDLPIACSQPSSRCNYSMSPRIMSLGGLALAIGVL